MTFGGGGGGGLCVSPYGMFTIMKVGMVLPYRGGTDTNCVEKVCA